MNKKTCSCSGKDSIREIPYKLFLELRFSMYTMPTEGICPIQNGSEVVVCELEPKIEVQHHRQWNLSF